MSLVELANWCMAWHAFAIIATKTCIRVRARRHDLYLIPRVEEQVTWRSLRACLRWWWEPGAEATSESLRERENMPLDLNLASKQPVHSTCRRHLLYATTGQYGEVVPDASYSQHIVSSLRYPTIGSSAPAIPLSIYQLNVFLSHIRGVQMLIR